MPPFDVCHLLLLLPLLNIHDSDIKDMTTTLFCERVAFPVLIPDIFNAVRNLDRRLPAPVIRDKAQRHIDPRRYSRGSINIFRPIPSEAFFIQFTSGSIELTQSKAILFEVARLFLSSPVFAKSADPVHTHKVKNRIFGALFQLIDKSYVADFLSWSPSPPG